MGQNNSTTDDGKEISAKSTEQNSTTQDATATQNVKPPENGVVTMTENKIEVPTEYTECEDLTEEFETASSCAPSWATQSDEDDATINIPASSDPGEKQSLAETGIQETVKSSPSHIEHRKQDQSGQFGTNRENSLSDHDEDEDAGGDDDDYYPIDLDYEYTSESVAPADFVESYLLEESSDGTLTDKVVSNAQDLRDEVEDRGEDREEDVKSSNESADTVNIQTDAVQDTHSKAQEEEELVSKKTFYPWTSRKSNTDTNHNVELQRTLENHVTVEDVDDTDSSSCLVNGNTDDKENTVSATECSPEVIAQVDSEVLPSQSNVDQKKEVPDKEDQTQNCSNTTDAEEVEEVLQNGEPQEENSETNQRKHIPNDLDPKLTFEANEIDQKQDVVPTKIDEKDDVFHDQRADFLNDSDQRRYFAGDVHQTQNCSNEDFSPKQDFSKKDHSLDDIDQRTDFSDRKDQNESQEGDNLVNVLWDMLEDDLEKYQHIQEDILALSLLIKRNGCSSHKNHTPEVMYTTNNGRTLKSSSRQRGPVSPSFPITQELTEELLPNGEENLRVRLRSALQKDQHNLTNLNILNMLTALMIKPSQAETPITLLDKVSTVAGKMCTLTFDIRDKRWYHDILESTLSIQGRDKSMQVVFSEECTYRSDQRLAVSFRPKTPGLIIVSVRSSKSGVPESVFRVEIEGTNPLLWFNQGSSWPMGLYCCKETDILWVRYTNHLCCFTPEGSFLEEILRLDDECINDLCVSPSGDKFAVSVSGWEEIQGDIVSFQEARIYATEGSKLLNSIGRDPIIFEVPIICIDFVDDNHLVIADRYALCRYSIELGDLDQRCGPIDDLGTVSKLRHCRDRYFVVDGATSQVKIYSNVGVPLGSIEITDQDNKPYRSLRCVDVDDDDNVIVCDSISNSVSVYSLTGALVSRLVGQWNHLLWPLGLTVSSSGQVFVADHGNASIKKYDLL